MLVVQVTEGHLDRQPDNVLSIRGWPYEDTHVPLARQQLSDHGRPDKARCASHERFHNGAEPLLLSCFLHCKTAGRNTSAHKSVSPNPRDSTRPRLAVPGCC